jgi:hypothetical protein
MLRPVSEGAGGRTGGDLITTGTLTESSPTEPAASDALAIEGVVTDLDGAPLYGVLVEAATPGGATPAASESTDRTGRFRIAGLGPGRYDLRFELDRVTARAVAIPAGTDQVRVRLGRPRGLVLRGTVPQGAEEPAAWRYVVERETPAGLVREQAGRSVRSRVPLGGLAPGRYTITVAGGSFAPARVDGVEVVDGAEVREVVVALSAPGGTIEGRVLRGSAGTSALVAWRRLEPRDPWPRTDETFTCGEDGRFVARGLAPGRYLVSAGRESGPVVDVQVQVIAGATAPVELRLP